MPNSTHASTQAPMLYDAIVVGAGPAGSTAAILLARAGWSVALVEKQRFPRRKVCGECLAASNFPLLEALGVAPAFEALAGGDLRQVSLLRGASEVTAELPATDQVRARWGRALGRETLDTLLLDQARSVGADVLQPWVVSAVRGAAGAWLCELRAVESSVAMKLRAPVLIDAHGSWENLPLGRPASRAARGAGDLLAFKANFTGAALPEGVINVLALNGGYGGMVVADGGMTTLACCIRRDRLTALRLETPGLRAGDAVQAWLQQQCAGVQLALQAAQRDGPWLACGPIDPGVRMGANDGVFRIGNAAGEAHPILGEGMSMALQSAALLCAHLLADAHFAVAKGNTAQAVMQARYAADWHAQFAPRLRLAAMFAHAAMRPRAAAVLMGLARRWPGLLTQGARWGGKVRTITPPALPSHRAFQEAAPAEQP